MASYGAKYLQWAPFAESSPDIDASAFPKYGTPMNLGPLVQVTDAITYAEAKNYGDNELQETASEFQELGLDAEITELPIDAAAAIYGATKTEAGDLEFGDSDDAPWGGLAFYTNKQAKIGGVQKKFFQGVFYPKLKASRQGTTYTTKGQSITFSNGKIRFTGTVCAKGKFQVLSANLETEAAAKAWVDALIKAASSS